MELQKMSTIIRLCRFEEGKELDLVKASRRIKVTWIAVAPFSINVTALLHQRSSDFFLESPLRGKLCHAASPGIGIRPFTAESISARRLSRRSSTCVFIALSFPPRTADETSNSSMPPRCSPGVGTEQRIAQTHSALNA